MKSIIISLIAFAFALFSFAQSPRSEKLKDVRYRIIKEDKIIRTDSIIIQINERMGDHNANAMVVYQKGDKLSFGDIWIEDVHGNILRKLKKNEIKDESYITNSSLYNDLYAKSFEMKHNQYPYKLVYSFNHIVNKYTSIVSLNLANSKIPIENGEVIIQHTIDKSIKSESENINSYSCDTLSDIVTHRWKYSHTPEIGIERYSSVNETFSPRLEVAPVNFKYAIAGDNTNWGTFGNWIYRLNKGRDKLTTTETEAIDQLIAKTGDKMEQIKLLYRYLQDNTRYINISTKYGGLQTHPASYVCTYKYGDCKALSNYMQAILKRAGIESFYTLIYADSNVYDLDNDFSYNAFNHAILTVPINNDTIFLECTSKNTPMGYIGTHIQGRKALIIKEVGSHLINVPQMTPFTVLNSRNINVELLENGEAKSEIKTVERGDNYEYSVSQQNNRSKHAMDRFVRNTILDGSYEILSSKISNDDRNSATVNIEVKANMKNVFKQYGNNLALSPLAIYLPTLETPENRKENLQIDYPFLHSDTITYNLAQYQYTIKKIPESISIESPYGDTYTVEFELSNNALKVYKQILITSKRLPLTDYHSFYKFITTVRNNENSNTYIETQ